jgi:malonyl-CoA decarboxylase
MGPAGTALLVGMRALLLTQLRRHRELKPLDADLKHLLSSWFNRGFLELRRIDWDTPAAILEKLIAYEAVHEIAGWADLRRRLAPDRRCFAFFHPALANEPLIFVEVALTRGMASAIAPLLQDEVRPNGGGSSGGRPDTAIFYSISNCQPGLRGVSFGNLLIKQVVEGLQAELPGLKRFATLSPVPGFRRWLERRVAGGARGLLRDEERAAIKAAAGRPGAKGAFRALLAAPEFPEEAAIAAALEAPLMRLCAEYLTAENGGKGPDDPVARFHLGNGARLERINWRANVARRGLDESYGLMVNYLYDPATIEANHEAFLHAGTVARSAAIDALLRPENEARQRAVKLLSRVRGRV